MEPPSALPVPNQPAPGPDPRAAPPPDPSKLIVLVFALGAALAFVLHLLHWDEAAVISFVTVLTGFLVALGVWGNKQR